MPQTIPRQTTPAHPRARPWPRPCVAAMIALATLLVMAVAAATASAAPGTLRLDGKSPALGHSINIAAPGGGTFSADPGRALLTVTPAGGSALHTPGYCVDRNGSIAVGVDYAVDLRTPADTPSLNTPAITSSAWLISRADALIGAAADRGREAAAIQVAVWQLTGQAADVPDVTSDTALNARVAELRALAAGRSPVTALALSAPATTGPGPATLTITGTPGAVVSLQVTAGAANLSASEVTLDAGGHAQVAVAATGPAPVVVTARAQSGALQWAARPPNQTAPQQMAVVTPTTVTASAPLAPSVVAAPPIVVAAPARARLRLVKTGPKVVLRGRAIRYALTVTNVSGNIARAVVISDPPPSGTFVVRVPPRAHLIGGAIVRRIGALEPGHSVTVHLRVRTQPTRIAPIVNVAKASAANAPTVHARAVTVLRAPARLRPRVSPAVTG